MVESQKRKVVIIGAGHVGTHCGMSLLLLNLVDELVYLDIQEEKARMEALDQDDAGSNLPHRVRVRAGTYADCADAQIVVMAVGKSREPGQTRLDMFDDSIAMMRSISGPLKSSGFHGVLISISNPADIVADYLRKRLDLPKAQVFSTGTSLDSARLRRILSELLGVDRRSIQAYCMGEHGDSQLAVRSHMMVGGIPLLQYAADRPELQEPLAFLNLCSEVRETGMRIVDGKGCTEFGIGLVCAALVRAVLQDEKQILPVSTLLQGEYGQTGIYAGVPAVIGRGGVERILEVSLTPEEQAAFDHSCQVIRGYIQKADAM